MSPALRQARLSRTPGPAAAVVALAAALPVAGGCAEPVPIEHLSALRGAYRRVMPGADAADFHAQAGGGVVTRRTTDRGRALDRFDPLPGQPEALLDVVEAPGAGPARVLAAGGGAFFDWQGGAVDEPLRASGRAGGVRAARLTASGTAVLRGDPDEGCVVDWLLPDDLDTLPLPDHACAPDGCVVADRAADRLLVTASGATWVVDRDGVGSFIAPGDLCAFDPGSGLLAVARQGERDLVAFDADGSEAWSVTLPHGILGLSDMGEAGAFAVSTGRDTAQAGGGRLALLDARDGAGLAATDVPAAGGAVAGGGGILALLLAEELHLFTVQLPGGR